MHFSTVVYIVDDDPMDSLLVEKLLREEMEQVAIYVFPSAQMAWERLKKTDLFSDQYPHLILLDKEMPILDGWQFMEAFTNLNKGKEESCKVIFLASVESKTDKAKRLEYQVEVSSKPISKEKFTDVIKPVLDKNFV